AIIYSTYLGGSGFDQGNAIAVGSDGSVYITGELGSDDFPTVNPVQAKFGGNTDAFVSKLNPAGSALVYSSYIGGSSEERAFGVAVDSAGNAYITGETTSSDFPTSSPLQAAFGGRIDAFVTKISDV